jgi:hypothetical protein
MSKRSRLSAFLALTVTLSLITTDAQAKTNACSMKQKSLMKNHITQQINALTKFEWEKAYRYSALSFQNAVPLTLFIQTIKTQYAFLVFNDGFGFESCQVTKNSFSQIVSVDYHGKKHVLAYGLTLVDKLLGVISANEVRASAGLAG